MATVQITTWEEFKTALTETITEATTYEIMNDIDVSNIVLSSAITLSSQYYRKTFQPGGDNEYITVNGITAYSDINIFYFRNNGNNPYTFNNIHFSNIMHTSGTLFNVHTYNNTYMVYFNNCMFSGMVNCLFAGGFSSSSQGTHCTLQTCSINVKCESLFRASYNVYQGYININPFSDEMYCVLRDNSENKATYFNNCYLTGTVRYPYTSSSNLLTYAPESGSINVYNIKTIITNYNSSTTYRLVDRDPGTSNPYSILCNIEKFYDGSGNQVSPNLYTPSHQYNLTDSQMKSRTYIQENTNFPLYG